MSRRTLRILLIAFLASVINLPLLHSTWTDWRVERSGIDVTAAVTETETLGDADDPSYWVVFEYDEDVDPDQELWPAQVDRSTWERVRAAGTIEVRVLEDQPSAYETEGQVEGRLGLVITLVVDAILLGLLLLLRRGRYSRPLPVRVAALHDVERCPPGTAWEEVDEGVYLARGEVVGVADDEIVLDVGDRTVVVILDGHRNEVGWQQPAQVRGRLIV